MNEKANQLAHYMHLQNIQHGDIVGIYLNKSLEVIVSMFAILKLGASFLPLDLDYPKERLNYILGNSEPKLILSSRNINKKINFKTKLFISRKLLLYKPYRLIPPVLMISFSIIFLLLSLTIKNYSIVNDSIKNNIKYNIYLSYINNPV